MALLRDEARWYRAQEAGIRRTEAIYTQQLMLQRYGEIYETALANEAPPMSARDVGLRNVGKKG